MDSPVRVLRDLVVVSLFLSLAIPFAVISLPEDSVADGARWVLDDSGFVAGLIGCLLARPIIRRWTRKPSKDGSAPHA